MRKVTSLYVLIVVGLLCAFMSNANIAMSNSTAAQNQQAIEEGSSGASGSSSSHYKKTTTEKFSCSETVNGVTTSYSYSKVTTLTKDANGNWIRETQYLDENGKEYTGKVADENDSNKLVDAKKEVKQIDSSEVSEKDKAAYEKDDKKYQEKIAEGKTEEEAQKEAENKLADLPDNADMTLAMKNTSDEEVDQTQSLGEEMPKDIPELPANFRGGDPDSNVVHCLEDVYYEKHEHSLIYNQDSAELASDSRYTSDPNITWDTKKKVVDPETGEEKYEEVESKNTNVASDGGKFYAPGDYNIGNSGARQIKSTVEEKEDAVGGDSTETEEGKDKTDLEKTVTALQNMGVIVHDVTPPDLWIAFKETTGSQTTKDDFKKITEALKQRIEDREKAIIKNSENESGKDSLSATEDTEMLMSIREKDQSQETEDGEENVINYANKSFLVVEEGLPIERDTFPFRKKSVGDGSTGVKTTRVTRAGSFFDESGALAYDSSVIEDVLIDDQNYFFASKVDDKATKINIDYKKEDVEVKFKNKDNEEETKTVTKITEEKRTPVEYKGDTEKDKAEAKEEDNYKLFVRKNVPFLVAAVMADNEDERRTATDVDAKNIQFTDNDKVIEPEVDGSYMFRKPNWPAEDYADTNDHKYAFIAKVKDASGNVTEVRLPVYVVDSYSSFESSK